MKSLLVVVGAGDAAPVLETGLLAARRFNSHIVGLHSFGSDFGDADDREAGGSIAPDLNPTSERQGQERRDRAQAVFRQFFRSRGIPVGAIPPGYDGPSASWLERTDHQNPIVGEVGRAYDLIVVEQPRKMNSIAGITFEEALFESGRPVLLVPKDNLPVLGEVVAIAWNGSTETAQAVALSMPFLEKARKVAFTNELAPQAADIAAKATKIRIPGKSPKHWKVRYYFSREGSFERLEVVKASTNNWYRSWGVVEISPFIDLSIVHQQKAYDKQGGKRLIKGLKFQLFGRTNVRLTKQVCEKFFENPRNFG